ncbi:hypothetical protein LCGC14_2271450, partial [marine sediment metagenome]
PEKMQAACRKWRNKGDNRERGRAMSLANKRKNRSHCTQVQIARYRKMGVISEEMLKEVYDYYGKECVYCGKPSTGVDHLIPVSKGGTNDFYNLASCCKPCNSKKYTRPIWVMLGAA